MPYQIPYRTLGGRYRPYLEVAFFNSLVNKRSKTFGLVDSGADHILIPYSLGKEIGLAEPTVFERLTPTTSTGVGGEVWSIERKCRVQIVHRTTQEIKEFDETIFWTYPFPHVQNRRETLVRAIDDIRAKMTLELNPNNQALMGEEIRKLSQGLKNIDDTLERDPLLGRNFFDNFSYVSFFHHDRNKEHQCYYEYEINEEKVLRTLPLQEAEELQ